MCGICGRLNFDRDHAVLPALVKAMADTIQHRGPDDEGCHVSGPVGLGFRRLAIIDLATGHQPLSNEDGTIWIVFNGEIYNYRELRQDLQAKGHIFKTQTDTEVIVHLYEEFGEACVGKLRGMFAFAVWDENQETLFLARDRVGIKPLYYWLSDKALIFASEIKAILVNPEVRSQVVPAMIDRFLVFHFVPGEETLLRNVFKLAPGSCMVARKGKAQIKQYWDLHFEPQKRSLRDAETEFTSLLDECVRMHMVSDVPVGFLLSGGMDSTAMLGIAAGNTGEKLKSFTVGFSAPDVVDERTYARLAAKHYGSEHHEITVTAKEFAECLPRFAWHMEEPACEPQAIALYYVTKLARDFVKVLISGEGGDEALAGYHIYRTIAWIERSKRILGPFRGAFAWGLGFMNRMLGSNRISQYTLLSNTPFESYYRGMNSSPSSFFRRHRDQLYSREFAARVDENLSASVIKKHLENGPACGRVNQMLYADTKTWLPDDLLLKADKMTMATSVELRVPFLDHKFLEFAASLPENFKVRGFATKYIAKRVLRDRLPREILRRKKAGFPVPYASWMRTELRDWVRSILLDSKTLSRGYFKTSGIEKLIAEDSQGRNGSREIFSLIALELWHRAFLEGESKPLPDANARVSRAVGT